ncbi:hypothetical protein HanHA89_Chr09g0319911 [Helianthus annuus]|nr:hypothetical protein HanHA89_Chr09g0319911 [Helianthus annuus]
MKEWYESRNTAILEGAKKINAGYEFLRGRVATLWEDRCKQQEIMKKRDDDPEDRGNPDPSTTSQQPTTATSSAIVVVQPPAIESTQGTSSGTVEEIQQIEGTSYVPSSADLALQVIHPFTGELLEEGEIVEDLSHQQLITLNAMRDIDDDEIDKMPSELESTDVENIEEIVFEGNEKKSSYVRQDRTEFAPFDDDWLKENVEDIMSI